MTKIERKPHLKSVIKKITKKRAFYWTSSMMKTTKKVAPDGGWGWMACFGVSLVNVSSMYRN